MGALSIPNYLPAGVFPRPGASQWLYPFSLDYTQFLGGFYFTKTLFALPQGSLLRAFLVKSSVPWVGTGVTGVSISIGKVAVANQAKFTSVFDLATAVSATNFQLTSNVTTDSRNGYNVSVTVYSTGAVLTNLVAGEVKVWAMVDTLLSR